MCDMKKRKIPITILPLKQRYNDNVPTLLNTVIVIHLHYLDTIFYYLNYIESIPDYIDIIITTSNFKIEETILQSEIYKRKKCIIVEKNNRGRDISALLVATRKKILEYDYICFIHDKEIKNSIYKTDIDKWVHCLWENMIGSTEYIENILMEFHKNSKLGILVPPNPISEHFPISFKKSWLKNYENTKMLVKKMNLECKLSIDNPPNTLGTVFWARVPAIRKLLEIEWSYEDFDPEPLENDGTISHAIERVFSYLAADAGYYTEWVMTDCYASKRLEYMQSVIQEAFFRLKESLGIQHISELYDYEEKTISLYSFCNKYKKIYIYGAGEYGNLCLIRLKNLGKKVSAFLVTELKSSVMDIDGIPVIKFSRSQLTKDSGIIIAINPLEQSNIIETINSEKKDFSNLYYYDGV